MSLKKEATTSLFVCGIALIVSLVGSLLWIPWNGFKATRTYGIVLVLGYFVVTGVNVLLVGI